MENDVQSDGVKALQSVRRDLGRLVFNSIADDMQTIYNELTENPMSHKEWIAKGKPTSSEDKEMTEDEQPTLLDDERQRLESKIAIITAERDDFRAKLVAVNKSIAEAPLYKKRVHLTQSQKDRVIKQAIASYYSTADKENKAKIESYHMNETGASRATIKRLLK